MAARLGDEGGGQGTNPRVRGEVLQPGRDLGGEWERHEDVAAPWPERSVREPTRQGRGRHETGGRRRRLSRRRWRRHGFAEDGAAGIRGTVAAPAWDRTLIAAGGEEERRLEEIGRAHV